MAQDEILIKKYEFQKKYKEKDKKDEGDKDEGDKDEEEKHKNQLYIHNNIGLVFGHEGINEHFRESIIAYCNWKRSDLTEIKEQIDYKSITLNFL